MAVIRVARQGLDVGQELSADPALAQHLVREVVHVPEDRQARRQPRRQGRPARIVRVARPEPLLEEAPVDRPRQPRERMIEIHDLVEPRPKGRSAPSPAAPSAACKPPNVAPMRRRDHGPRPRSISKETHPQARQTGKHQ